MATLDHLVVSAGTLESGADWVSARLGVPLSPGGKHPLMGTHNCLLGLGPTTYLEVIAIDPDAPDPGRLRWFGLDRFAGAPRLTHWVVRVADLDVALAAAPAGAGRATDLARGDLHWRFGVTDDGQLPFDDAFPALIEWLGSAHPAQRLPDRGCRLLALEIASPEAVALRSALPVADQRIQVIAGGGKRALIATPDGDRWLE